MPLCFLKLLRRIDADDLLVELRLVDRNPLAVAPENGGHVGEIVLVLGVVVPDLVEAGQQRLTVEGVDPHVELPDGLLLRRAVLVLHDAQEVAVFVPQDTAIGQIRLTGTGEHGAGCVAACMGLQQLAIDLLAQQGHIAVANQNRAVKVLQKLPCAHHRMACAELGILNRMGIGGEGFKNLLPHIAPHQNGVLCGDKIQLLQYIVQKRLPTGQPQNLGQVIGLGHHAGAFSGGQYHCFR